MTLHIHATQILWTLTLVLAVLAGYTDVRERRIPNWLTVSGLFIGIGVHTWLGGWRGTLTSLEGAGLALAILLPLVLVRGLGAGDWKLMGAVGAFVGPLMMLFIFVASALVTGLAAMIRLIQLGRVRTTFSNMWVLVQGMVTFGLKPNPEISLDTPGLIKIPFGPMVAIGTLICFVATRFVK